mmetsp:Transcript_45439/g.68570  ORF Transcript_45439/g.68570 Transcript_45439/m.68570 type:complete len:94 (+) Transcript_45439:1343-1624(+)
MDMLVCCFLDHISGGEGHTWAPFFLMFYSVQLVFTKKTRNDIQKYMIGTGTCIEQTIGKELNTNKCERKVKQKQQKKRRSSLLYIITKGNKEF